MKKLIMFPLLFDGHSVTMCKDSHMTTASASPYSSVAENATVTLTLTPASGYEVKDVEVVAGGVTVHQDDDAVTFTMGEADVIINVTSQANNLYKVLENRDVWINGSKTSLTRNMTLEMAENGMVKGVACTGTAITLDSGIVASLVSEGIIEKLNPAWKGTPTPSA